MVDNSLCEHGGNAHYWAGGAYPWAPVGQQDILCTDSFWLYQLV
jgi:hypothetical protein